MTITLPKNEKHLQSIQPYATYKPSSISWLKEIPTHWDSRKAQYLFTRMQRPTRNEDEVITAFRDGQVTLRRLRREEGYTFAAKEIGYQGVRKDDLVISAMDAFAGAIGVSDSDGKCSPVYSVCKPASDALPHFYGYMLQNMARTGFITSLSKGIRERSTDFRFSEFKVLELPLPPLLEQRAIVAFLDRETVHLDGLIKRKERLLELLEEQRQAVISQAVTRGLNPDVALKDSGVSWLGPVPEGWRRTALKHVLAVPISDGPHETPEAVEDGVPFVSAEAVKNGRLDFSRRWGNISREMHLSYSKKTRVQRNDLLMVKSGNTTGNVALVDTDEEFSIWSPLALIRANQKDLLSSYAYYALRSSFFQINVSLSASYGTQPNIGMGVLGTLPVPLPPTSEQQAIAIYLNVENAKLDALGQKLEQSITRLREYRAALITAAVTGQIDVREATNQG
ncbi:restriction endonuclease subunit S [Deinococcus aquaedulcis]|uniref:restriction endonuclease subunit S n=1 Tax=Deinococcus aquaedulcis TaxID=2840455 RepID=UPI001C83B86A|nr:restriction endonuclease subunit S [Deinococcus aquaedulcis]